MRFPWRKPKRRWESSLEVFSSSAVFRHPPQLRILAELPLVAKTKEPINPFYVLVVLLGVIFAITSCAYGTMAYRAIAPVADRDVGQGLMTFLDRYGIQALAVELTLLALAAFGAMGLDQARARQIGSDDDPRAEPETDSEPGRKIS